MELTPKIQQRYIDLYKGMTISDAHMRAAKLIANRLIANRKRYEIVSALTHVPWHFIAIIHERESSANFSTYLGDGEPLDHPTHNVPKGRGPFGTWEAGGIDALVYMGLDKTKDWSLGAFLFLTEKYNGLGYFNRQLNSPYVWSWSSNYIRGKYNLDGHYDHSLVDQQCGCAVLLAAFVALGVIPNPIQEISVASVSTASTAGSPTVTVPVAVLQKAANVSQTSVATNVSLGIFGSLLAFGAPILSVAMPGLTAYVASGAGFVTGLGVLVASFVSSLHLNANATAVTNSFIASTLNVVQQVAADFGLQQQATPPSSAT